MIIAIIIIMIVWCANLIVLGESVGRVQLLRLGVYELVRLAGEAMYLV